MAMLVRTEEYPSSVMTASAEMAALIPTESVNREPRTCLRHTEPSRRTRTAVSAQETFGFLTLRPGNRPASLDRSDTLVLDRTRFR